MPIVVRITDGLVAKEKEASCMSGLINAFLDVNGILGSKFFTPRFVGEFRPIPVGRSFVGPDQKEFCAIELRLPTIALSTTAQREQWIKRATDILLESCDHKLPPDQVFVNFVYGDDAWGIGGKYYTDKDLGAAIEAETAAARA